MTVPLVFLCVVFASMLSACGGGGGGSDYTYGEDAVVSDAAGRSYRIHVEVVASEPEGFSIVSHIESDSLAPAAAKFIYGYGGKTAHEICEGHKTAERTAARDHSVGGFIETKYSLSLCIEEHTGHYEEVVHHELWEFASGQAMIPIHEETYEPMLPVTVDVHLQPNYSEVLSTRHKIYTYYSEGRQVTLAEE